LSQLNWKGEPSVGGPCKSDDYGKTQTSGDAITRGQVRPYIKPTSREGGGKR